MSDNRIWASRAEQAQTEFRRLFWNEERGVMDQAVPGDGANDHWIYWWHAHVIDVLVDELQRSGNAEREAFLERVLRDTIRWNGGTLLHNYYDDMEWMALALLRGYETTGHDVYKQGALELWADIKTAWNDHMGGGMAWKKDQLDYKNTPANAPASILASRLYRLDGRAEDLEWAMRIYQFNRERLVCPNTGFVWDGMNRLGDGEIDYDWKYTYCQGVFLGAGIELYHCTGEEGYLADAQRTAHAAVGELVDATTGMLPREGNDDCGLFKGILVRYLVNLIRVQPDLAEPWVRLLRHNAETLWRQGRSDAGLISLSWTDAPEPIVQLSGQLSGIMLLEAMAALEREGFLDKA